MSIKPLNSISPLDVRRRITELKQLKRGWLDGNGFALSPEGLDWFATILDRLSAEELPLPYLFPTAEGNLLAEWSLKPWSITLEVDLQRQLGSWHSLNVSTDEEFSKELNLTLPNDWLWLNQQIRTHASEAE